MLEVGEHRAASPRGHRNSSLINSLFFITSPTADSFWSRSSVIASAVGSTPHTEQFLKEKAFPDICSELTALLLLLPHFVSPVLLSSSPSITTCPWLTTAHSKSGAALWIIDGPHLLQPCASPSHFLCLLLTQDLALSNGLGQSDPNPANHLCNVLSFTCPGFSYMNHRLELWLN